MPPTIESPCEDRTTLARDIRESVLSDSLSDVPMRELDRRIAEDDADPDGAYLGQTSKPVSRRNMGYEAQYRISRDREHELDEAVAWYNTMREGLGAEFADEVRLLLTRIAEFPDRFPRANAMRVGRMRPASPRAFSIVSASTGSS